MASAPNEYYSLATPGFVSGFMAGFDQHPMKLGLGLYRHMLVRENFQFARQAGATHIVAHLVDYFKAGSQNPADNQPTGTERGWGLAGDPENSGRSRN
jgi:hypothetical protein